LVVVAAWALGEAGVELVDVGVPWRHVARTGACVVLHDPLCPTTPPGFIADCVAAAATDGKVVVGVRPVTDTVKTLVEGHLGATVDRELLVGVCSPIVLPPAVAETLTDGIPTADFAALVARLRESHEVAYIDAPVSASRISSVEDLRVLAALAASE
jgi:2-C-methyl-D-erythritol 4-phosphate cytidylyltransferase